jgi:hypothetical protein
MDTEVWSAAVCGRNALRHARRLPRHRARNSGHMPRLG